MFHADGDDKRVSMLSSLVEYCEDAIVMLGLDGRVQGWNAAATEIFGYSPEEMIGQKPSPLYPADRRSEETKVLQAIASGQRIERFETVRQRKDGNFIDVSISLLPLKDPSGTILGAVGVARDISESKRAQRETAETLALVTQAEARLKLSLLASQTGTWDYDAELDKIVGDDISYQMYGVPGEEFTGTYQQLARRLHPEDRHKLPSALKVCIGTGCDYSVDYRILLADGTIRYIASDGKPFFDQSGRLLRLTGICRDVTRNKLQEAILKRVALLEQREDFIKTLTHDLKNPLMGSIRLLELLHNGRMGPLTEEQKDGLDLVRKSDKQLLTMLESLIEVYRLEESPNSLVLETTDLAQIIEDCLAELRVLETKGRIALTVDGLELAGAVVADAGSMRRVFQNLLGNAVKFGDTHTSIAIRVRRTDQNIIFEITDSGPGIPVEDRPKIFERFNRGKNSGPNKPGNGLGLYICSEIVKAHGGEIDCISALGQGTTFLVALPLYTPEAEPAQAGAPLVIQSGD